MAEADFNGDGKPDLVVSNLASSTISILLGNGDGTFQPRVDFAAATGPSDLAVADFNHDGKLDLAVIISGCPADGGTCGNSSISVFLGNGDGTFQTHVDYMIGNGAASFTEADINGDGKLDLAISESDDGKVSVLLGNGDGTLQQKQDFPVDSEPLGIAAADFNGDGRMDLAVGNYLSNNMSVLLQILPSPIATASLAASTLTFTSQPVGSTSSALTVTLNDTGTAPLAITSITASGDFAATNTCGTTVAAGGGLHDQHHLHAHGRRGTNGVARDHRQQRRNRRRCTDRGIDWNRHSACRIAIRTPDLRGSTDWSYQQFAVDHPDQQRQCQPHLHRGADCDGSIRHCRVGDDVLNGESRCCGGDLHGGGDVHASRWRRVRGQRLVQR